MTVRQTLIILSLLVGSNALTQTKPDIGLILSLNDLSRVGMEFRTPVSEKYLFKTAITRGEFNSYRPYLDLVSATDSLVIQNKKRTSIQQWNLRFGLDRRLKSSIFSLGTDLNLGYRTLSKSQYNMASQQLPTGEWVTVPMYESTTTNPPTGFYAIGDPGRVQLTQHFFVPSMRITFNMDVPLGKAFLVRFAVVSSYAIPVYMGATNRLDPDNIYGGEPPITFEFQTTGEIGLRYVFGNMNKLNRNEN